MKTALIDRLQRLGVGVALLFLAGLWSAPAGASTFVYYLPRIDPDVLPTALPATPWTVGVNTTATVADPSNILTLVDGNGTYGPFYSHALSAPEINSSMDYEERALVRVTAQTETSRFLFAQDMSDGTRYLAWGMMLTNSVSRFFLLNTGGLPLLGTTVDVAGTDFFQVDLRKTGTNIVLSVNNTPIISAFYTDLSSYSPRGLDWGDGSSPAMGTAQVMGISYGIGELAPELVPEPSTVMLAASGAFVVLWRRRRQS